MSEEAADDEKKWYQRTSDAQRRLAFIASVCWPLAVVALGLIAWAALEGAASLRQRAAFEQIHKGG